MNKKGDYEWLDDYGWAILSAIVAVGVLAYFGVFTPDKYSTNECLKDYAVSYCNSINMTYYSQESTTFYCLEPKEIREIDTEYSHFKFLDEEIQECKHG